MSDNVHGHQKPAPYGVNTANPVFARQQPEAVPAEIPQGQHGAPALRSELEPVPESPALPAVSEGYIEGMIEPDAPIPAQDAAIDAADESAHNAAVAAEVAEAKADDAAANAEEVHSS